MFVKITKNEQVFRGKSINVKNKLLENNKNLKGEFVVVVGSNNLKMLKWLSCSNKDECINCLKNFL